MKPILTIVGPTASGKTRLGIALARALGGEILSADAMQFYRGMEIGAATATPEEQEAAPHHLISILTPDQSMAAGDYQRIARLRIGDIQARGKQALVVGGSGLYLRALLDGLFEGPPRDEAIRDRLREEAREWGNTRLMERLRLIDPEYAATLTSENDLVRVVRALEVYEITGTPFSRLHQEHQAGLNPLTTVQIGLNWDREDLYARIDTRVDLMIAQGWLEEVVRLLDEGYGPHLQRLKALGYRELAAYLHGEQSLDEAVAAAKQHHRRYAKRQMTWFRADKRIHWLEVNAGTNPGDLAKQAEALWTRFLLSA